MFKQLFKPKWRHQDPAQRLAALQQLSPNTTKSQQIIAQLCRDTDSQVQKTAIGLCTDSQLLEALAAAAPPVSLWAQERRIALLSDQGPEALGRFIRDRKSTRLNSSHVAISYAVFCLKKKTATTA